MDIENLGIRILSDKGIKQALDMGLIKTTPAFDYNIDSKRVQSATLDVRLLEVDEVEAISHRHEQEKNENFVQSFSPKKKNSFHERSISTIKLTEIIDFGQLGAPHENNFLGVTSEARSTVRLYGCYIPNCGYFHTSENNSQIEIGNFSQNQIHFSEGDRVAQLLFSVDPFDDKRMEDIIKPSQSQIQMGEMVRSLDVGMEVVDSNQIMMLQLKGFLKVSPVLAFIDDFLVVHASDKAYRMKKIDGGIDFANRKKYSKEDLLEPINISKGYTVRPFEHIIIETQESFELSKHIGIRFWDNLFLYNQTLNKRKHLSTPLKAAKNVPVMGITDGWIDPGYSGGFSRQPKWLENRTIHPGDVVGFGQVFFFPNGVGTKYGNFRLGSQYNNAKNIRFSKS
ncbi:hypothetical protein ACFLTH_09680 [Bacteroidota bacterium]